MSPQTASSCQYTRYVQIGLIGQTPHGHHISLVLHRLNSCNNSAGAGGGDAEAGLLQGSSWGEKRSGPHSGLAASKTAQHSGCRILWRCESITGGCGWLIGSACDRIDLQMNSGLLSWEKCTCLSGFIFPLPLFSRSCGSVGSEHDLCAVASARAGQVDHPAALWKPAGPRPRRASSGFLPSLQVPSTLISMEQD